jgi:hypothetical protein
VPDVPDAATSSTALPSDAAVPDTGVAPDGSTTEPPTDGGLPSEGEAIPGDLIPVTEFDEVDGYVETYGTLDAFESIIPDINQGVATFEVPFDAMDQSFAWRVEIDPAPQDFTGGTLVVRARLVSGLALDEAYPGAVSVTAYSHVGSTWSGRQQWHDAAIGDGWVEYELPLDGSGWDGNYSPSAIYALGFELHTNNWGGTDSDVAPAVFEVDWVGIRPAVVTPPDDGGTPDTDSGTPDSDGGMTLPDGGSISMGEPIPDDITPIAEFDSAAGYVDTYDTTVEFQSIGPDVAGGLATFSIPFDAEAQAFNWRIDLNPTPQDLSGGTLVARIRVVSGFCVNPYVPGVLQLYSYNGAPNWGGTGSWNNIVDGNDWNEYELNLDQSGWGYYDSSAVTAVGFKFNFNTNYTTDADAAPAVIEVDWIGVRMPATPITDGGMSTDSSVPMDASPGDAG